MTEPASPRRTTQVTYTYCRLVDAGTIDISLGWVASELAPLGADLSYFLAIPGPDFYPHYTHELGNLFRFGGCIPAINAHVEKRPTVLLALQWMEDGGVMLVRAADDLHRMADLRGKRIGLSKSRNAVKVDYRRVTEERGVELMLQLNGLTRDDVEIVDCHFADDWYERPEMAARIGTLPELWRLCGMTSDLAFGPLVRELDAGEIDACFVTDPMGTAQDSGRYRVVESFARYPDRTLRVGGAPYALTCTRTFADEHPDLVTAYVEGLLRVGRWANANPAEAAAALESTGFFPAADSLTPLLAGLDLVPDLSPWNLRAIAIEKDFMLDHGFIARDLDVEEWAAPEFLAAAHRELDAGATSPVAQL
jgi:ABC-type nitrate/sulfonate/bicarbonate transport system substrate-binding protein